MYLRARNIANIRGSLTDPDGADELLRTYDRCAGWTDALIVQEWIAGDDTDHYTCNAYFGRQGEPLVTLE